MEKIIDVGSSKFNIEENWYNQFCNKYEKEETTKSSRTVFQYDWQRFLWAFILGIFVKKRTKLTNKTKTPPFGKEIFNGREKVLNTMIALTLQELYGEKPDELKADFEKASEKQENLGKTIKIAIEEYANTGFSIISQRGQERPGYIESIEDVVVDILSEKSWSW